MEEIPIIYDIVFRREDCDMVTNRSDIKVLNTRRKQLGMSYAVLADRSGVSEPTVHRVLSGAWHGARYSNVVAIADALGLAPSFADSVRAVDLREQQARQKAQRLVGIVQGTSGLEGQAVDERTIERMVRQTVHELLTGTKRKLWAE